jgi:hypothetical protein
VYRRFTTFENEDVRIAEMDTFMYQIETNRVDFFLSKDSIQTQDFCTFDTFDVRLDLFFRWFSF